jgi:hypothetical protein
LSWVNWAGAAVGLVIATAGAVAFIGRRPALPRAARYGFAAFLLVWGLSVLSANVTELIAHAMLGRVRSFYHVATITHYLEALAASLLLLWASFAWPTASPSLTRRVLLWSLGAAELAFVLWFCFNPGLLVKGITVGTTYLSPQPGSWVKWVQSLYVVYAVLAAGAVFTWKLLRSWTPDARPLAWLSLGLLPYLIFRTVTQFHYSDGTQTWINAVLVALYTVFVVVALLVRRHALPGFRITIGLVGGLLLGVVFTIVFLAVEDPNLVPLWVAPTRLAVVAFAYIALRSASAASPRKDSHAVAIAAGG